MIIIEFNPKCGKIPLMLGAYSFDKCLWSHPLLLGLKHDRCTVRIICAHKMAYVASQFLKAHPDIRLQIFDEMAYMDGPIRIREGTSYENFPFFVAHCDQS